MNNTFSGALLFGLTALLLGSCAPTAAHTITQTTAQPAPQIEVTRTPLTPTVTTPVAPASNDGYKLLPTLSAAPIREFKEAQQVINPARSYRAVLHTNKGDIALDLNAKAAPLAVNSFVFLARNHFYDGTRFHRVIDGFMAQGGDPKSADMAQKAEWGTGGPGYMFDNETSSGLKFNRPGLLAMANSGPNTNGSQFFITFAPAEFLNGGYTIFGLVADSTSMKVLYSLTKTATSAGGETPIAGAQADVVSGVDIWEK